MSRPRNCRRRDSVEPAELRRRGAAAMKGRRHIASAFIVAALALNGFAPATSAHAQSSPPPPAASTQPSEAERALAARYPRQWANLDAGSASTSARELPALAIDGARGAAAGAAELPAVPQSAPRRAQASARRIAPLAPAPAGAARTIPARVCALPGAAAGSARSDDEAVPAIPAASARAARTDDGELASMAADDAGAAPGSAPTAGTLAATAQAIGRRQHLIEGSAPGAALVAGLV